MGESGLFCLTHSLHVAVETLVETLLTQFLQEPANSLILYYAFLIWQGDPIDQKETILFDRVSGWIDVKTSYYHSIACSFEGAASDPYPES